MKLNRRQLRRLIESVINESEPGGISRSGLGKDNDAVARGELPAPYTTEEVEEQVSLGVNIFNDVLKEGGYHPQCTAMPANVAEDERIHFFVKCEKGSEDAIVNYLEAKEEDIINTNNNYDAIEHYYSIERPGRIRVEIATFD
jgi:hypothetical protein